MIAPEPVFGSSALHRTMPKRIWATPQRLLTGAAAFAVGMVMGLIGRLLLREDATPTLNPRRIAVLYFADHSEAKSLRHLTEGLTETLIHELSSRERAASCATRRSETVSRFRGIYALQCHGIARRIDCQRQHAGIRRAAPDLCRAH